MTEIESRVVAAWQEAAKDLGIQFTSPFYLEHDGSLSEHLGVVHHFGRHLGTVISVLGEPSSRSGFPAGKDYYSSVLSPQYSAYQRQYFIDTLDDWTFFGPDSERPSWYSGKNWS